MSELEKALEYAVIFDRRDNTAYVAGRAAVTSRLIKDAARRQLALEDGTTREMEWCVQHESVPAREDDGTLDVCEWSEYVDPLATPCRIVSKLLIEVPE
jgi:hypothetical protein